MYLVNILLTSGLVLLISAISVLSICAFIASSKSESYSAINEAHQNYKERRKNKARNFPVACSDGTMVYFERRLQT